MRFQPITLAVLLAVATATPARAGETPPTLVDRSERVADVRGLSGLDVDNARGRVSLRPSTDGRLHLVATRIFRMGDVAAARRYATQTSVTSGERGGRFAVNVHYPHRIETGFSFFDLFSDRGRRRFHLPSIQVVLEIQVPPGLPVRVTTTSGDVQAEALGVPVSVVVTSGDVTLTNPGGPVSVQSVSGDVTLTDAAGARVHTTSGDVSVTGVGALDCSTVSGDVEVDGARGAVVLDSQSGDLTVQDAPAGVQARTSSGELAVRGACGRVRLQTTSGEIRTRLRAPFAGADLSSVSGDVLVEIVPGLGANLAAATTSGSIDCNLPTTVSRHDRNHLDARIGRGGPALHIGTVSGNLTVTSGGK